MLTFSTGAFAPGVTVDKATYRMWAIDGGIKWNGLAINGQYFMRWLDDFVADGPLPLASTFDHGFEMSAGYFVVPKKLMLYGRGSWVLWGVRRLVRVWRRREVVFPSDRATLAQHGADPGQQSAL